MMLWFKRFAVLGGIVIVLELVAWVGIATLGPDAFRQMIAFYDPRPGRAEVIEERGSDGALRRCAVYRGEVLCIDEGGDESGDGSVDSDTVDAAEPALARRDAIGVAASALAPNATRCATYEGQEICIGEDR
jgi:hypothetical protein